MTVSAAERRARFRELHGRQGLFVMPNPWDIGSARILASLGFEALATTSAGFAWALGKLDTQVTRGELVDHVAQLAPATDLPLNVDSERCFPDDAGGVAETVRLLGEAGAAGCSIEDWDPVAGRIEDVAVAVERVAEAAESARAFDPPLVLTGRAENHLHGVDDLDDTIARLVAYRDAGADCVYAPWLATAEEISAVVDAVGVPVNVLAVPATPPIAELAQARRPPHLDGEPPRRRRLRRARSGSAGAAERRHVTVCRRAALRGRQAGGVRLDAARGFVVHGHADEVADREHPDDVVALDHGKVAEAAVDHERGRLARTLVRADGVRAVRHRLGDRALDRAGRDRAEDVALGDDPDQALALRHDDRSDPPLVHPPGGVDEARRGIEPEDVPGHDLPDGGHVAIVDLGRLHAKKGVQRRPFVRDTSRWNFESAFQRLRSSDCARLSSRRSRCASSASSFK